MKTKVSFAALTPLVYYWWPFTLSTEPIPASDGLITEKQRHKPTGSHFHWGVANIPHDSKRHKGGEDAWVTSEKLIAIADGVGGWEAQGVDSGLFSKQLCKDIQAIAEQDPVLPLK